MKLSFKKYLSLVVLALTGCGLNDSINAHAYREAAEQGDAEAQHNLGGCYYLGKGVPQDDTEAVKWFSKAAEQGDAEAQFTLGVCYGLGKGVLRDYTEAVKWYRKAAAQGHSSARTILKLRGIK